MMNDDGDALHKIHYSLLICNNNLFRLLSDQFYCQLLFGLAEVECSPNYNTEKNMISRYMYVDMKKRSALSVEGTHYRPINA